MTTKKDKNQALDTSIDPKIQKTLLKLDSVYDLGRRKTMNDIEIFTPEQIAKILKISEGTLYALVKSKEIPHFYTGKRVLRFNKRSIIAWLQKIEDIAMGVSVEVAS
jgi:excisionase family DNA binding protein